MHDAVNFYILPGLINPAAQLRPEQLLDVTPVVVTYLTYCTALRFIAAYQMHALLMNWSLYQ